MNRQTGVYLDILDVVLVDSKLTTILVVLVWNRQTSVYIGFRQRWEGLGEVKRTQDGYGFTHSAVRQQRNGHRQYRDSKVDHEDT